jgi:G6PDH family F420-dependent oxidoreductase
VALLSDGRFFLGLGAGENLNEHVTGGGWPPINVRHQMLSEAVDIIRGLLAGGYLNYQGAHFQVDSAKVWDLPPDPIPLGVAASGVQSCHLAGSRADFLIAVQPESELVDMFEHAGGHGKPKVGQLAVAYDTDRDAAVKRALAMFGWFGGGWKVNAELPGPAAFEAVSKFVRPEDITGSIPCGASVDDVCQAVRGFIDAGFTHVVLCQVGGGRHQQEFITWAEGELLPALRQLSAG